MTLAVRYGKPVIAFFGDHEVDWRPPGASPSRARWPRSSAFVREALAGRLA